MELDWVIVGGGIHGVHLAARLIGEAGVSRSKVRVVDPAPSLLHTWHRCSSNTGMAYLRSPGVHHLDFDAFSLLHFGGAKGRRGRRAARGKFAYPYDRPATSVFADHCDALIERFGLDELHVKDRAASLELTCEAARVTLDGGDVLTTQRVLLAVGASEQPRWPAWAQALREDGAAVHHVFERGFCFDPEAWPRRVAVVGGGLSAAQVALRLRDAGKEVLLVSRHPLRKHQFDSDPWLDRTQAHAGLLGGSGGRPAAPHHLGGAACGLGAATGVRGPPRRDPSRWRPVA